MGRAGKRDRGEDRDVPDIALEVVVTHRSLDKLEVYRGLGVREVWIFEAGQFRIVVLRGGQYEVARASEVLPEVDLPRLPHHAMETDQHAALRAYREELRRG